MPLALPSGGDARPYIRFGASINAWQMSGADGKPEEFAFDKPAVFDIQNTQLGWMLIETGNRDWQPWPNNVQQPRPEGEYKAGFDVSVYSTTMFDLDHVRSYSSNAAGNVMFIQDLYNAAELCPEFAQGKSPVVQITGSKAMKVGKGTTRIPQFQILKWVDRPAALDGDAAPTPAAAAPAAAPKAAAAPSSDDEF
jgi:hypothetical protein